MSELGDAARRFLGQVLHRRSEPGEAADGTPVATDGASAVAAVEAQACDAGCQGPASITGRHFRQEARRQPNLYHRPVTVVDGTGDRGGLATALGLQASGLRSAVFLTASDLTSSLDLLAQATRRQLPLLVHLGPGPNRAAGGDIHGAYHAASVVGACQLFACDPQEAVDLTLIARRVAEAALNPALVAMDGTGLAAQPCLLPSSELVRGFLGDPGEPIHPPTASQEMLFGKHRRRVPRWHDLERPLLTGATLGPEAVAAADAARRLYVESHLPALLEESFALFGQQTGRRYSALRVHHGGAKLLLVAQGSMVATAETVADGLRAEGLRVGVVGIRVLRPIPSARLAELLQRRRVAVLERVSTPLGTEPPLLREIRAALDHGQAPRLTSVLCGLNGSPVRDVDLAALVRKLSAGTESGPSPIYLGLDPAAADTSYPKRQALRDALERSYPGWSDLGVRGAVDAAESPPGEGSHQLPPAVRRRGRSSVPVGDLAAFWDRVGVLYRDGVDSELLPDPFLATGAVPPLAGALRPPARAALPVFDPAPCTGCGDCWSVCPDGAVVPGVLGAQALIDVGMRLARQRGHAVDKLRMVASKLARRVQRVVTTDTGGAPAGEILDAAFEPLMAGMKLPADRAAAVRDAYQAVRREIAELPLAHTEPFFENVPLEGDKGGSGVTAADAELLALAIDPDACTGCGLCVAACAPGALVARASEPSRTAARRRWQLVEGLPAPPVATLERIRNHPDVGPMASALLSRQAREVMTAGSGAEAGSGEALAIRQILGAAADHLGPRTEGLRQEVEDLRSRLAAAIHEGLADALPDRDLESLARGLDGLHQPDAELAELTHRVETAFETERVDVPRTRRLVAAARALEKLGWRLERGEGGMGAAPFSVVVAGSPADWSGTFPHHPFAVPAAVGVGTGADLARGLATGHRQRTLEIVRTLRRARLGLEPAGNRRELPSSADEALEQLRWDDLAPHERRLCPPVLLLVSEQTLTGPGAGDLAALLGVLASDLPILAVVLADPLEEEAAANAKTFDLALVAWSQPRAFFIQGSVAAPDHLATGLTAALDHGGPSFLRIHAPSPARHGWAADAAVERAREAVASGALPLVLSPPGAPERPVLGRIEAASEEPPTTEIKPTAADVPVGVPRDSAPPSADLERRHREELEAVRAGYEARIAELESNGRIQTARRVHHRLLRLALGHLPDGGTETRRSSGQPPEGGP